MPGVFASTSKYAQLYMTSKRLFWDPAHVDLSADRASWERIREQHPAERYAEQILLLLSLFHSGEESVTRTLAPFLSGIARAELGVDKEVFLTSQLYEEAKHFEFFSRYLAEVLGDETLPAVPPQARAVLIDDLEDVSDRIRSAPDERALAPLLVEGVTHYMGVVESMLARTGYRGSGEALSSRGWLPGLDAGFTLIRRDEGRHIAFGVHFIREMCARDPSYAEIVRSTFERHLPNVMGTVMLFDYPHPLVPLEPLQQYALDAYAQFMAAGIGEGATEGELEAELAAS